MESCKNLMLQYSMALTITTDYLYGNVNDDDGDGCDDNDHKGSVSMTTTWVSRKAVLEAQYSREIAKK